jgi:hypothetical protein
MKIEPPPACRGGMSARRQAELRAALPAFLREKLAA